MASSAILPSSAWLVLPVTVSGTHLPLIGRRFDVGATLDDNDDDGDEEDADPDDDGRLLLQASERQKVLLYVPRFQLIAGVYSPRKQSKYLSMILK